MTASPVWRLAEWTGRVLLLGAVAFWWGLIVVPRLVSLAFPELLSLDAIPRHLDPDSEGHFANAVSAVFLLITALLAFVNAVVSHRRALRPLRQAQGRPVRQAHGRQAQDAAQGWIAAVGWAVLAATAAYLAWEEVSEFHAEGTRALGEMVLGAAYRSTLWPLVLSPLILAFVLAMVVFVSKGLPSTPSTGSGQAGSALRQAQGSRQASSGREVRALLILGLSAWLLAVVQEVGHTFKASLFVRLLEETLEFGGTLVIGLSAGIALRGLAVLRPLRQAQGRPVRPFDKLRAHGRQAQDASRQFGGRGRLPPAVWRMATIAIVACIVALGVVAASVHRAPLADARARTQVGAFHLELPDSAVEEHSLVQELGVLPAPLARVDLRVANHDPQGRPGTMIWRVMEAGEGGSGPILREGRMEVPARDYLSWESIDFPPLVEVLSSSKGRLLALQLVADVEPEAQLRIGATKTNRYEDGRLWINGELAWPDQNIEFAVYMAADLTRDKLRTMWGTFTSDWRWPVLAVDAAIAMTVITLIPALLITAALRRRGSP